VCFPHAGGAASAYFNIARSLPESIETFAIQYPGREDRLREAPLAEFDAVLEGIEEALSTLEGRPLALFGHSMGGLLAFEAVRRLEAAYTPSTHLFVSSCAPPDAASATRRPTDSRTLISDLKRLGGTSTELLKDQGILDLVLPVLRADYEVLNSYAPPRPGVTVACPMTAICGRDDPTLCFEEMQFWKSRTTASFEAKLLPGGHFYLSNHLGELIDLVVARLSGIGVPRYG
jgi:surfactin synthase thioesterase subunit